MIDQRFYELVKHLWRSGSYSYYWTPDTDEGKMSMWFRSDSPPAVAWRTVNVYFGIHPSRTQNGMRQRAKITDIEAVNCLFAEFDLTSGQSPSHLLAAIDSMDKPPSVVIFSGGGYHCYWLLEQTYFVDSDDARQRIVDIQAAWVDHVGSDDAAKDLARVLRVPGTYNRKPEYAPNFPKVEISKFDLDLQYSLDELSIEVEQIIAASKTKRTALNQTDVVPVDLDDTTIIEKMRQRDNVADQLWDGNMVAYNDDHSEADLALCSKLAFWLGRDPERIDRVFRRSGLFRPKWLRDDYRTRTIDKAITGTTNTYQPNNGANNGNPAGVIGNTINFTMNGSGNAHPPPPSTPPTNGQQSAPQPQGNNYLLTLPTDDEGVAECVDIRYAGQFLYTDTHGWLQYTGTHWSARGAESAVDRAVTETLDARIQSGVTAGVNNYADLIKKSARNNRSIQHAKAQYASRVYADIDSFDNDPNLLNCPNGVVDLRTGQLYPHTPQNRFMYCCAVEYKPHTDFVEWQEWLANTTSPESAEWLQIAAGYSLTGHTREEVLFYLYGPPRSGKGTFIDALKMAMGNVIAQSAQFATFTAERTGDSQNFDLAPLKPARLIAASESNTYERFNEAKIKQITGGDSVRCAFKHHDQFEYTPQFKIWLVSNHPVNADPDDDAVWGRVRVVEFPHSHLGQEDKTLKQKMHSIPMLESVLFWSVQGAVKWYKLGASGMWELDASVKVKDTQRAQLDYVQQWLDECCKLDDSNYFTPNMDIRTSYELWCKANGTPPKQSRSLTQALLRKGFNNNDGKATRYTDPLGNAKVARGFYGIKII